MSAAPPRGGAGPRSFWAVASLGCALVPCPPFSAVAIVLGVAALIELSRYRPHYTGRRLARAGIAIGAVVLAVYLVLGVWWHANVRVPLLEGPADALRRGLQGDVPAFVDAMHAPEASGQAEAATFLDEVRARYGGLIAARPVKTGDQRPESIDRSRPRVDYAFQFEKATVEGEAVFVVHEPGDWFVLRFGSVTLRDDVLGDLSYPGAPAP